MVDKALQFLVADTGRPTRQVRAALWFCIFLAVAAANLTLRDITEGTEFLWIVNALALAGMLSLRSEDRPQDVLAALGIAVAGAHMVSGTPPPIAAALALVHMLEVGAAAFLYRRALHHRMPHDDEGAYLNVLAFVVIPAVVISAIPGGLLLSIATDTDIGRAALNWLLGNALGLAGFFPLALWILTPRVRRHRFTLRELQWTIAAITLILTVLGIALAVDVAIEGILTTIFLTALFALRCGRVGAMILSAVYVPMLALTGILGRETLPDAQIVGLQTELFNLAALYTCLVLPTNLIAAMIARLQQAERTQRDIAAMKVEFLSTMSHEIKTPMNAIHGMFELFSRSELTDRQRRWADAGLSASRNLQAQVSQILEMARLEENTIRVKIRPVDPRKLLENWITAAEAGIIAAGKDLDVGGSAADSVPETVMLDEGRVQQILINLLTNAVKFSEAGQILINMRAVRGALVVEVSDTGIGIAPEDQGLVFERFVQVDSGASRRRDGTGLGLAISRELAILMGGSLTLRSTPGEGSTFRLTLPLISATRQAEAQA